jgi:hypothetical protein
MATELADFPEWKCPYCGKLLPSGEYNQTIEEFRVKTQRTTEERRRVF